MRLVWTRLCGAEGPGNAAQRQTRALGGEVAQPLVSDGELIAILILGPKDTPYRAEDWSHLAAFAQITTVAMESAAKHRTIESLNQDLQVKVDKIAEQQRRILALQSQLHRQAVTEKPAKPVEPRQIAAPKPDGPPAPNAGGIVGSSPTVRQLMNVVRKVAVTDAVVLLRGESGTGKELLARAVHETSPRAGKPYVKVHCAALSANLLESELFGHVKGAFTGAMRDKVGRFELADGGTLFLDEIGDITLDVQTKLLRVLQEKTLERVGSSEPLRVDVRIVTATHQDLEELIRQGRFREDLFYRLNVFPIHVPALRERREDIPELVDFFVKQSSQRCKKKVLQIDDDSLALLKSYDWPGNIRELENMIERGRDRGGRDGDRGRHAGGVVSHGDKRRHTPFGAESRTFEDAVVPHRISAANAIASNASNSYRRRRRGRQQGGGSGENRGIARSTLVSRLKKLGIEN